MVDRRGAGVLLWVVALFLLGGRFAYAHGGVGTQQINNYDLGPYRIFVWSDPDPPRVGNYHVSVALTESLDNDPNGFAGAPVLDADVVVEMRHESSGLLLTAQATHANATNKVFYVAVLTPQQAGAWQVRVIVEGPDGPVETSYTDDIEPTRFPWMAVAGGVLALLLAGGGVALYLFTGEKGARGTARPDR